MRPETQTYIDQLDALFPGEDMREPRQRIVDMVRRAEMRHRFWKLAEVKSRLGEESTKEELLETLAEKFYCSPKTIDKYIYPKPEWAKESGI